MRRLLAALLIGAAMPATAADLAVTVAYLARIATPPGAVLDVRLEAAGRDEPLAMARVIDAGNPPVTVSLAPEAVPAGATVRAVLRLADGSPFFAGEVAVPGGATAVEIMMHSDQPGRAAMPLVGPRWRFFMLDGAPVASLKEERALPYVVFDAAGHVAGSTGCNRMGAGYTAGGDGSLRFAPGFGTMMACEPDVMAREQAVFALLARVDASRIDGDRLILSGGGTVLAVLVAEPAA